MNRTQDIYIGLFCRVSHCSTCSDITVSTLCCGSGRCVSTQHLSDYVCGVSDRVKRGLPVWSTSRPRTCSPRRSWWRRMKAFRWADIQELVMKHVWLWTVTAEILLQESGRRDDDIVSLSFITKVNGNLINDNMFAFECNPYSCSAQIMCHTSKGNHFIHILIKALTLRNRKLHNVDKVFFM